MPPHVHYCEPFAGGLSVLLRKDPEGVSEVVNDLNFELSNFWLVLQGEYSFAAFKRIVEATPFSQSEWQVAGDPPSNSGNIERAVAFFVRCRQSMAGRMASFSPLSRTRTRRGMNEQVSSWLTAIEGLPAVHARLKRVVILNDRAENVIAQQDGPDTLFYLDPPYVHGTRTAKDVYACEMADAEHVALLGLLNQCKGKVMLSGYDCDIYRERLSHWRRVEWEIANHSASGESKRKMVEVLWCNF